MKAIPLPRMKAAGKFPLVCAPLVARERNALLAETAAVAARGPDILEWRVDFFEGIGDTAQVVDLAARIRQATGLPLLFTRRHAREGGEAIALSEQAVVDLYTAVCRAGDADLVDFEMSNEPAHVAAVREASRAAGIGMVMSFHDFRGTPALHILNDRFAQAQEQGADVAKVAVMPGSMEDVITLLEATLQSGKELQIPLVSMAMGGLGALTRVCGWAFGSAMTFGVGQAASAPGQLPIGDLQAALAMLRKAAG
jgi:3-dehydroquinate dehydratase-1